ncbi:hypothetical protein BVRB_6g139200 [Beta vulgaris subsp. vulgaris]|nr:hypothetical protein BVRB_6g139200 [Beta vulgaris subsp. vulgaris]
MMGYFEILVLLFSFVLLCYLLLLHDKTGLPTNWPLLGMLPALLKNIHRIHNFLIEIFEKSHLTFLFDGPWFTNMQILLTIDPANIHHVMSKNFGNYPKGTKFNEMFDVLGDGIFNADFLVWQYHRKMAQYFLGHPKFHHFLVKKTREKLENGLIPVLDHVSLHGIEVDLQDLFARFTFDVGCTIMMDHDPKSLVVDLPTNASSKALDDVEEAIFHRHVVPTFVWKLQRWLNVGKEYKYRKAWETLDSFIYQCIAEKRKEVSSKVQQPSKENEVCTDLLTLYIKEDESDKYPTILSTNQRNKFIRDTVLTNFIAGRDAISITLSWFFYLLSVNPLVASRIKKELDSVMIDWRNFKEANSKLVYLHGALCETLRLYAPVAFEAKAPMEPDILPSGHRVNPNMQIIFNLYAMGRMKSIWGDDCNEFKPERWISAQGNIRHEPSYKFFVFNAGPRTCLGKEMAFTQMKVVAATMIQKYVIEVVDERQVIPNMSIFLRMKHGFKVRILRSQ